MMAVVIGGVVFDTYQAQQGLRQCTPCKDALYEWSKERVKVIRQGDLPEVTGREVMVGDALHIRSGNQMAVGGLLIRATNMVCEDGLEVDKRDTAEDVSTTLETMNAHPTRQSPSYTATNPFIRPGSRIQEGSGLLLVTGIDTALMELPCPESQTDQGSNLDREVKQHTQDTQGPSITGLTDAAAVPPLPLPRTQPPWAEISSAATESLATSIESPTFIDSGGFPMVVCDVAPYSADGNDAVRHDMAQNMERLLEVPGVLCGIPVSALPDFGSSFDIISEDFLREHHLPPDPDGPTQTYTLPDGRQRTFLGTITLPWSFASETTVHRRVFHILRDSIYPLLFGRPFLKETNTMSKHVKRIKEVFVRRTHSFGSKRVLFVDHQGAIAGSTERILGLVNGRPALGFADTCSDISIIRRSVARLLDLTIMEGPEHTTEVQFVDGSTAHTSGVVKNVKWCFGVTLDPGDVHQLDFHVMDDIPCAIILDKWLLWDNGAFDTYSEYFIDISEEQPPLAEKANSVCLIQVKKRPGLAPVPAIVDPRDAEAARLAAAADGDFRRSEQRADSTHLTASNSLSRVSATTSRTDARSPAPSAGLPVLHPSPSPSTPSRVVSNNSTGAEAVPWWKKVLNGGWKKRRTATP
jgi:hypothetical protein